MAYLDSYQFLRTSIHKELDILSLDSEICVSHVDFSLGPETFLPGQRHYACSVHGSLDTGDVLREEVEVHPPGINHQQDAHVIENREFRYAVFHRQGAGRAREILLLFHGLNEKAWFKYFPWAHHLARTTGKAVLLFPLAFHMNRTLLEWSDHRLMHQASKERRQAYPDVTGASLSNVAISTRLHAMPLRFLWSGLQTYDDVVQLLKGIQQDLHPLVEPGASVDILAYSVGCLLAQVLMMANPEHLFETSRLCLFCGGAVFNRMHPVSKFILDSKANLALSSCLVEHLESTLRAEPRLRHYLSEEHPEGMHFRSLLNFGEMRTERETQFRRLAGRMMAIALEGDAVVPPCEVINTLQGSGRNIPVPVQVLDFAYSYQHEDPFPILAAHRDQVDRGFRQVFDTFGAFLHA